jgi:hypothetical protein
MNATAGSHVSSSQRYDRNEHTRCGCRRRLGQTRVDHFPVVSGTPATLILQTEPGATCQADFSASGKSGVNFRGFKRGPTAANSDGQITWDFTYNLNGKTNVLQMVANVACSLGDRKGTLQVPFEVHKD